MSYTIESVDGPITADQLGVTLTHEHVFIDLRKNFAVPTAVGELARAEEPVKIDNIGSWRRNPLANLDNLVLDDVDTATSELSDYRSMGGDTLVDVTSRDIGRDVVALRTASGSLAFRSSPAPATTSRSPIHRPGRRDGGRHRRAPRRGAPGWNRHDGHQGRRHR